MKNRRLCSAHTQASTNTLSYPLVLPILQAHSRTTSMMFWDLTSLMFLALPIWTTSLFTVRHSRNTRSMSSLFSVDYKMQACKLTSPSVTLKYIKSSILASSFSLPLKTAEPDL